ncbi:MAG: hypothetical protein K5920_03080 [Bacteroidales bacterium]|nr:hypothetical protein [Bacteroidales bacterium]
MDKDEVKFTIEGNPGQGNTFINIGTAYNVNPNATKVENTFILGGGKEADADLKESQGRKPKENVDIAPIRTEILRYVSRVRPLLVDDAKCSFMTMWEDVLRLPEVEDKVYNSGKQVGTNFNRDLVANILYHLRMRKIYKVVYKDNYNGAAMAEALEGDKEHAVKHALRDEPSADICEAIDAMLKKKY